MQGTVRPLLLTTSNTIRSISRTSLPKFDNSSVSAWCTLGGSKVPLTQSILFTNSTSSRSYTTTTPKRSATTSKMPSQQLPTSQVAWQLTSPSGPLHQGMKLNQTAPVPQLKANQTLVRVLSASLNPVDYKLPEIGFMAKFIIGWPHTPAVDYVGRVWSTTLPSSTGIKSGDLVFGKHDKPVKYGTLAQFTLVDGIRNIAHVPNLAGVEGVDLDWYASVGVAGLTAYQSLIPALGKGPGQGKGKSVFINGGSGGTGVFGIQIAKHVLQCDDVVVSCSGANVDLCKSLGADQVIDYRSENLVDGLKQWAQKSNKKFDLIVDNVGANPNLYWQCHDFLKPQGKYLQIGLSPNLQSAITVAKFFLWPGFLGGGKRKYVIVQVGSNHDNFADIGEWIKQGKIKGVIDQTFAFEDAAKAYERLRTGRSRGKIVVRVNDDGR